MEKSYRCCLPVSSVPYDTENNKEIRGREVGTSHGEKKNSEKELQLEQEQTQRELASDVSNQMKTCRTLKTNGEDVTENFSA